MHTLEQLHDDVDPLDREYAPGWVEEEGAKLRGFLREIGERDGGFGVYRIYTFELAPGCTVTTTDGEASEGDLVAVHARRSVLRRKLANAKLEVGDEAGIKYMGPPRGTAKSHRYRVVKYMPDGGFIEAPYDAEDESDVPRDEDAATQEALEFERDQRDEAASEGVA